MKELIELGDLAERMKWNPELLPLDDEHDPAAIPHWTYDWLVELERKQDALSEDFQAHLFWGSVMGGCMGAAILVAFTYLFWRVGGLG